MKYQIILAPLAVANAAAERLGSTQSSNFEVIGEGLTFESAPEPPIDRRRILEEAFINGSEWEDEFPEGVEMEEEAFDPSVNAMESGEDSVGEPLEFAARPIARKLRRVSVPVNKAKKESMRDVSAPLVDPIAHTRALQANDACDPSESYFKIDITTDNYGFENDWTLKSSTGDLVQKGPPGNSNYADNTRYVGGFCLPSGSYEFTVNDQFRDGMCCGSGMGSYTVEIDDVVMFQSPTGDEDWSSRVHSFTIGDDTGDDDVTRSINYDAEDEDESGLIPEEDLDEDFDDYDDLGSLVEPRAVTRASCQNVKIQFRTDKYGKETSVYLKKNGSTVLQSVKQVGAFQTKTIQKCVSPGTYQVIFKDNDGLCCRNGQGWYKVFMRGVEVVRGGYFIGQKSHTLKVGYNYQARMTSRDKQWLASHNSRRRTYHRSAGKTYKPLRWSATLASQAKGYANRLLGGCSGSNLVHAKGIQDGENLAKNKGSGNWGKMYPADNILKRWVENEKTWNYPKNAHLTQVVWRATRYVGCGESVKSIGNGQTCRVQVCRYTRAGNCNVRNGNWRSEAFKDDTACGKPCPNEGCFA
eukprot:g6595.t1 g6595   contig23:833300-835174(+)